MNSDEWQAEGGLFHVLIDQLPPRVSIYLTQIFDLWHLGLCVADWKALLCHELQVAFCESGSIAGCTDVPP